MSYNSIRKYSYPKMWCKGTTFNSYFRSISCIFAFQRYNYLFWRMAAEEDRNEKTRRSKWKAEGEEIKKRGCIGYTLVLYYATNK